MGTADVIPGVSGGTMAFILGIYPRLLAAINSFDLEWLRRLVRLDIKGALSYPDFQLLVPLGLGIFAALMFFTRVIPLPILIITHPEFVYALFFGLILGSIIVLLRQIPEIGLAGALRLGAGFVLGFLVVTLVPTNTPDAVWFVFLSGALAITAMILPGISGSFVLLILGKYAYIFDAIGRLDLLVLLPFGCGAVTGLALFSRFLAWLLRRYHDGTMLVINGVLIASLWVIWPFQERSYIEIRGKPRLVESSPLVPDLFDTTVLAAIGLMLLGISAVLGIHAMAERKRLVLSESVEHEA
jgi:putative membrane protein